jgi:hypothetical protein
MIFQGGIDLELKSKNVQAVIDFDTGLIGFTEIDEKGTNEYRYEESPKEFKLAFLQKLESIIAEKCNTNFKISRKNK